MTKLLFIFSKEDDFVIRNNESDLNLLSVRYGIPPSVIVRLNNLERSPVINEILAMRKPKGLLYRVKLSDNLKKLAIYCHMSEREFLDYNKIPFVYPFQIVELYRK